MWSTWDFLDASARPLADGLRRRHGAGSSPLTDTLTTRLAEERGGWSRLQAVVDLVDESARGIHYPHRFWQFAPRSAERTWATAYGHDLDRAVLAATLLAAAGFEAVPIFVGPGIGLTAPEIPRLAGMGDLQLIIKKPSTIFDPAAGTLTRGVGVIGKPLWRTDDLHEPFLGDSPWQDLMTLDITLEAAEDGSWTGHGFLDAGGVFSPFNDMAGPGTRSHDHVAQLLASVLPGAELTSFNPDIFNQYQVAGGFAFTLPAIETDDLGRRPLNVGRPAGGYLDHLPGGVNLYDASRMTPVGLPAGPLEQRVRIRIDTGTAAVVHHPAAVNLANAAGEFTVAAALDGSWLTVERSLRDPLRSGLPRISGRPCGRCCWRKPTRQRHDPAAITYHQSDVGPRIMTRGPFFVALNGLIYRKSTINDQGADDDRRRQQRDSIPRWNPWPSWRRPSRTPVGCAS